ncbi:MAG: diguanylate cyclase [Colwellia polaris]|jgi:diguanylate cyclase (GGDEF)-like protein|uniref:sensor domain-containing diguanylate cyclase n=1 Tax=Colwellia polaris TaxID=326537 RepID=UPI000A172B2E|nr:diguanylate cyclase [Colwellia polaris]|tara:strand:+ start:4171 stop:6375 length:2205 start_codon:yes stop_codon:yes gene_type:complete
MTIAPIKVALKLEEEVEVDKTTPFRSFLLALSLGLLGALLNFFPIELAHGIALVIGNLAFIIAAAYLRPVLTLLCALICVAPLLIMWGHPFGFITFGCEALFVSYLRGRGWYLPTADFLYWLIIGMPITAILLWINASESQEYLLFTVFKQGINAVFYTALAVIMIFVFSDKLNVWITSQQPKLQKNLKQYLHYILWIMSAFFVVGVCLYLSRNINDIQQQQIEDKLEISSQYLGQIVENYVEDHKNAIAQVSRELSSIEPSLYQENLAKVHELYPGFITMLVANKEANIVATSPLSLMKNLPKGGANVSDRSYFVEAFYEQSVFISPAFLGRAFGSDPIVAISAPIYSKNEEQPIGIVEGSLNLNLFTKINRYSLNDRELDVVLTDENDNVIYAESNIATTKLAKLNFTLDDTDIKHNLIVIGSTNSKSKRYLYRKIILNNGWKILVLIEHKQVLMLIEQQYLTIFVSLFLIFILVVLLANQIANTLNKPLAFALKELAHGDGKTGFKAIPYDAPSEFLTLYDELQQSKTKLLRQQFILEDKVNKRTQELNKANIALKELANKDSLTGLYNRRYLENKFSELQAILSRNNADMVVAMLDLDHFKQLNDEYGHLIGDNCLTYISDVMKRKFDRRSDIVARFGGEEFIIVAQSNDNNGVLQMLEEFREEIEQHSFPHDSHNFVNITISIGTITAKAKFSANIDDWVRLADEQLYHAKSRGRNQLSNNNLTDASLN